MDAIDSQAAWNEATERVMTYLTCLEIGGFEHRTRQTLRIIETARKRCAAEPQSHPVEVAMAEATDALRRWYDGVLPGVPLAAGVVATMATGASETWPDAVLSETTPEELRRALTTASIPLGPSLQLSGMSAKEMDFGAMETIAQETWQKFAWGPVLRAAALWTVIFFVCLFLHDWLFPV